MSESKQTPPMRIRVAQDADGFWTCREAVSGSQEYVRAHVVDEMLEALIAVANVAEWESANPKMAAAVGYARATIAKAKATA